MMSLDDEDGAKGALRLLKMAAENPASGRSLIDAIRDAASVRNDYNDRFLATIAAQAIDGWSKS